MKLTAMLTGKADAWQKCEMWRETQGRGREMVRGRRKGCESGLDMQASV